MNSVMSMRGIVLTFPADQPGKWGSQPWVHLENGTGCLITNTWTLLFAAWTVCYLDRSVTGPVVAWMIANGSPMLGAVDQPHSWVA